MELKLATRKGRRADLATRLVGIGASSRASGLYDAPGPSSMGEMLDIMSL